jgi:hypothetical protein
LNQAEIVHSTQTHKRLAHENSLICFTLARRFYVDGFVNVFSFGPEQCCRPKADGSRARNPRPTARNCGSREVVNGPDARGENEMKLRKQQVF